jgi:adenylate cyclase
MGFVMLYNHAGRQLEMRAYTDENLLDSSDYYDLANEAANEALEHTEMVCRAAGEGDQCSVMCVPLILRNEIIGVFGAINRREKEGFTSDDRRLLYAVVSQMDTAILESLERRRLRRVLSRSVDPNVLDHLLTNPNVDILEGQRAVLTVLYADLRGSTPLAERLDPAVLVDFINDWLTHMAEIVLAHGGTLDKFIGDEVMAIFGAPLPQPDHALRAVRAGLEMQAAHQTVVNKWHKEGVETAYLGVGIATGELIVGEIGSEQRTDYTVVGQAANLGSRICSSAHPNQVLISEATYELVTDQVEAVCIPGMHFKGIDQMVAVYDIRSIL